MRRRAEPQGRRGGAAARPYTHLSRICAMSIGDNCDTDTILKRMHGDE
jgi:hypothetical protein